MMETKKIITTGGTGLVGSRVIEMLGNDFKFIDASLENDVDLLDPVAFNQFFDQNQDASTIIHFAAYTDVREAEKQVDQPDGVCYQLNVELTRKIAKQAAQNHQHLIYISTDYVFAGTQEREYLETDSPAPINWYGQTKLMGKRAVIESEADHTILRIASPFRSQFEPKMDYVRKIIESLKNNSIHPMFTDQTVTVTFINDIARAIRAILESPQNAQNRIFHIVGNEPLSPYQIAQKVARQLEFDGTLSKGSLLELGRNDPIYTKLYPRNLALSNQRFCQEYDFKFSDLDQVIQDILH